MHTIGEVSRNVPAFLGKLWKMVEDPETDDFITWNSGGTTFVIKDEIRFARELLPMYYKHNNMASFIRQLNMYGFHKIVSTDTGCLKMETPEEIQFEHPFFLKGHPYLLENIKRKINTGKVLGGEKTPQVITKVLKDMTQMKGRQDNMDGRLMAMKLENEALWRELSLLRQKHIKQQQIVNKLIQFLVTIVQQNQTSFTVKRKFHRMLQHEDKLSPGYTQEEQSHSPGGPVIHELDPAEALLETVVEEAQADTPTDDADSYFLSANQPLDEEGVIEMPNSNEPLEPEVILPDILIHETDDTPEVKFDPTSVSKSNTQNVRTIYIPKSKQKETVLLKPPLVKLIPKNDNDIPKLKLIIKPNNSSEEAKSNQSAIFVRPDCSGQPQRVQDSRKSNVATTKYQNVATSLPLANRSGTQEVRRIQLVRKPQEIKPKTDGTAKSFPRPDTCKVSPQNIQYTMKLKDIRSKPSLDEETNCHPPTRLQVLQNNQLQKLQNVKQNYSTNKTKHNQQPQIVQVSRNNVQFVNTQRNSSKRQMNQPKTQINNTQQSSSANKKPLLIQRLDSTQVEPIQIIGIPLNDSEEEMMPVETVELDPLQQSMEGTSANYSLPVIVDVPAQTEPSPGQQPMVSPQDLLLGSPVVINDPVMTPMCEPVVTPVLTPASATLSSPASTASASTASASAADMQVACVDDSQVPSSPNHITRSGPLLNEMDSHIDNMQADLDNLKELLRSEGISLDANALLGYFNEDPFAYNISDPIPTEDPNKPKENSGNELMAFANNSSFYDLADLIGNDMSEWSLPSPGCSEPHTEDTYSEVNTPQFVPQSPSFAPPAKKRKK